MAYQEIDGIRRVVDATYRRISEREFGFVLAQYDTAHALVIDPVLVYSTLLGGTDDTWATGIALSRCGEAYITGWTWAPDFPTTAGAFDTAGDDNSIMGFVSKLNPSGSALMYSTYVSGTVVDPDTGYSVQVSQPAAIALDSTGHAYITGVTQALDYPVTAGSWYANLADVGAGPGYITKLNSNGSDLIYSTYLPVTNPLAIAVDSGNNAYFTAQGRAWKLNAAGTAAGYPSPFVISSIGLTAKGIAVDAAGSAYVVGSESSNIATTPGAFQSTKPSSDSWSSAYLVKVNPAGTAATYATWLGTTQSSGATAVAVDSAGNAYVTGGADGGGIPNHTGPTTLFTQSSVHPSDSFAFVAKVAPDGSHLDFYARLGGSFCNESGSCFSGSTTARGIDLDPVTGSVWIAGETSTNRLQLVRPLVSTLSPGINMFAAKIAATGTTLQFSTLLGGATNAGNTAANAGIRVDSAGSAYVAGSNIQTDFPTTSGAFQTATLVPGVRNAFVAKINESKDSTIALAASPSVGAVGSPTTLTATLTGNAPTGNVTFKDGGNTLGTGAVSGTTAQLTTSALVAGSHTLTAAYEGDAHNNPSLWDPITYSVSDPNAPPTAFTITGITDGQVLTANIGAQYVGGSISANATAAFGNTIANVIIFVDGQGYTWTTNLANWSGFVNLQPLGVGLHTIRGTATDNNGNILYAAPIRFVVNAAGSTPPATVSITSPTNGATLAGPGTFALQATAAASATIVRFYAGNTLVGTAGSSPFTANWVNPAAGTYSLVAVASDATGAAKISAPVNVTVTGPAKPTVTLTSPANNSDFWVNQPITIAATATPAGAATIDRVELYDNELLMTTRTALPYQTVVTPSAGTHVMFARAYDSLGQFAESKRAVVRANAAAPPTVSLTAPTEGQTFTNPASITISATASPVGDASITKVEFYDGSTLLGTATAPPYGFVWNAPAGGSHFLMAVATDSRYQTASTGPINIAVVRDELALTVDNGIDGSTVPDRNVSITGTLQAPPNSSVSIGAQVGTVTFDGRFFFNEVPLAVGSNTLEVTLNTQDGPTTSQTITVNRSETPGITVDLSESSGVAPFATTFRVQGVVGPVPLFVEFDINGDGIVDIVTNAEAAAKVIVNLGAAGYNRSTVTVKDSDGVVRYSTQRILYAVASNLQASLLTGIYTRMLDRLRTGTITSALTAFTDQAQLKYGAVFDALGPDLTSAVDQLGAIRGCTMAPTVAELLLVRQEGSQLKGFEVQMLRGSDGIWRIEGM